MERLFGFLKSPNLGVAAVERIVLKSTKHHIIHSIKSTLAYRMIKNWTFRRLLHKIFMSIWEFKFRFGIRNLNIDKFVYTSSVIKTARKNTRHFSWSDFCIQVSFFKIMQNPVSDWTMSTPILGQGLSIVIWSLSFKCSAWCCHRCFWPEY